mmetsp:Transcript_35161/g.109360  ORF Transcript_35161/g.109360 Transcript_35161/m.109360 type:complete len:207 (+) Transcript_35161:814-1434(+)
MPNLATQSSKSVACAASGTAHGCSSRARPSAQAAAAASKGNSARRASSRCGRAAATSGSSVDAAGPSRMAPKVSIAARRRGRAGDARPASTIERAEATQASATARAVAIKQARAAPRRPDAMSSSPSSSVFPERTIASKRAGRSVGNTSCMSCLQSSRLPDCNNWSSWSASVVQTSTACTAIGCGPDAKEAKEDPRMASKAGPTCR